jgi:hypothetical protein
MQGVIPSDYLIRREQMVKCTKGQVRRLKTALRWKIPPEQRQRIQMVLLRESRMTQRLIAAAAETRFIGEHDPQGTASPGGSPLGFPHSIWKAIFLKAF